MSKPSAKSAAKSAKPADTAEEAAAVAKAPARGAPARKGSPEPVATPVFAGMTTVD